VLAALGAAADAEQGLFAAAVDVGGGHDDELADPRPAMGQHIDDGDVAGGPRGAGRRGRVGGGVEEHVDILAVEGAHRGVADGADGELGGTGGVAGQQASVHEVAAEAAQSGQQALAAGRGQLVAHEVQGAHQDLDVTGSLAMQSQPDRSPVPPGSSSRPWTVLMTVAHRRRSARRARSAWPGSPWRRCDPFGRQPVLGGFRPGRRPACGDSPNITHHQERRTRRLRRLQLS
jgi:hypothetical protein